MPVMMPATPMVRTDMAAGPMTTAFSGIGRGREGDSSSRCHQRHCGASQFAHEVVLSFGEPIEMGFATLRHFVCRSEWVTAEALDGFHINLCKKFPQRQPSFKLSPISARCPIASERRFGLDMAKTLQHLDHLIGQRPVVHGVVAPEPIGYPFEMRSHWRMNSLHLKTPRNNGCVEHRLVRNLARDFIRLLNEVIDRRKV
jgi:hypothetical protein